jgi:hypothetical protein
MPGSRSDQRHDALCDASPALRYGTQYTVQDSLLLVRETRGTAMLKVLAA